MTLRVIRGFMGRLRTEVFRVVASLMNLPWVAGMPLSNLKVFWGRLLKNRLFLPQAITAGTATVWKLLLQWNGSTALRSRQQLETGMFVCVLLRILCPKTLLCPQTLNRPIPGTPGYVLRKFRPSLPCVRLPLLGGRLRALPMAPTPLRLSYSRAKLQVLGLSMIVLSL